MKLLVTAAGCGSGFNGRAPRSHKTLSPVLGLTVIERILAACPQATELVMVTGHEACELERRVSALLRGRIPVRFVRCNEWRRGNGVSVLAAREVLEGEERFLLTMSDHVFEPGLVERLTACPPKPGECILAVDRNLDDVFDLDDATKTVISADGRIRRIGKQLEKFDAADTGVFYCTPALFGALEQAQADGGESLSDGISVLCHSGQMRWCDVSGCMWQDVDDPGCLAEARRRVWRGMGKPRDGVVSRLLNRRLSGLVTRLVCGLPLRPNHVTVFNILLAGLSGWLMATGSLLAGGLLAQAYSVLDGVDGELSRLKHQGSWFGAWLDNLADRLCDWMIIAGACLSVTYTGHGGFAAMLLAVLALLSNVAYRSSMDSLLVSGALRKSSPPRGLLARVEGWFYRRGMVFGVTHDMYLFILALGVALGSPLATMLVLTALETSWWALKSIQAHRAQPSEGYAELLRKVETEEVDDKQTRIPELAAN